MCAGRVLVLIQVPALARRQTSTRPAPCFQKLLTQLLGATASKNQIPTVYEKHDGTGGRR